MGMEEFICKVKCHFLDVAVVVVVIVVIVVIVVVAVVVVDVNRDEQKKLYNLFEFFTFCYFAEPLIALTKVKVKLRWGECRKIVSEF